MAHAPIPVQQHHLSAVQAYRNSAYIAREIFPAFQVAFDNFDFPRWNQKNLFTLPATEISRRGEANETEFSGDRVAARIRDDGLRSVVPRKDIDNAPEGLDPLGYAGEALADLLELGRERRVAEIVFGAANYPAANKTTLSGTDQWSDPASDPVGAILAASESMLVRPNTLVVGPQVLFALKNHPDIRERLKYVSGGSVTAAMLAGLFEVERVVVGEAMINAANRGKAMSLSRVWGPHAALLHVDKRFNGRSQVMTFGAIAERGARVLNHYDIDPGHCGVDGGVEVFVGEKTAECVVAPDLGYLFSAAVA